MVPFVVFSKLHENLHHAAPPPGLLGSAPLSLSPSSRAACGPAGRGSPLQPRRGAVDTGWTGRLHCRGSLDTLPGICKPLSRLPGGRITLSEVTWSSSSCGSRTSVGIFYSDIQAPQEIRKISFTALPLNSPAPFSSLKQTLWLLLGVHLLPFKDLSPSPEINKFSRHFFCWRT